jgi:phosphatidylserine/phosphatidylglycerophosphate/cardiolipin synthase-like enzyme
MGPVWAAILWAAMLGTACFPGRQSHHVASPDDAALGSYTDCKAWDDPRLRRALDRKTHSTELPGNMAELLINGNESFTRRFENAYDADVILVKTFIFSGDEMGQETAKILMERARAGAFVVVQYDLRGSITSVADVGELLAGSTLGGMLGEKAIFSEMRQAGVMVVPTNSVHSREELEAYGAWLDGVEVTPDSPGQRIGKVLRLLNHMDHEKYWITGKRTADGGLTLRAILGGMNIASEYAYGGTVAVDQDTGRGGWRDTDIELVGPVVNEIVDRFFDVLEFHLDHSLEDGLRERLNPPQEPAGNARVRFVWNQPRLRNQRTIERLYQLLIAATPKDQIIRLEAAYFAPGYRVGHKLRRALRRDRRLAIITNSAETVDAPFIVDASLFEFRRLLRIRPDAALYLWKINTEEGEIALHSKLASFGTCGPVVIGSANLDAQSTEHNSESVVMVRDPELRQAFDAMFDDDRDLESASRVNPDELARQGLWQRFKQASAYGFGWYWL